MRQNLKRLNDRYILLEYQHLLGRVLKRDFLTVKDIAEVL